MTTIMTQAFARLLLAPTLLAAIAVLVKGYVSTGDGFSAGVIAGIGITVQYVVFGYRTVEDQLPVIRFAPTATLAGLLITLMVVFVPVLLGRPIITHFPRPGESVIHIGTLEILTAVAFDIGVFLIVVGFIVTMVGLIGRVGDRGRS